jgi:hypothetical protein
MSNLIAWTIVGCGIAVLIGEYALHLEAVRLQRLERCTTLFYENLDILIKDKNVPKSAIELFGFLNDHITRSAPLFCIFCALFRGFGVSLSSASVPGANGKKPNWKEILTYYDGDGGDLHEPFLVTMVSAIYVTTYNSPVFGWIARRLLFPDLNHNKEKAPDIISAMSGNRDGYAHA